MTSILLVKTTSLGDVIHNLAMATDLRRRFPEVTIDWLVEESFAGIPRLHPAIRDVIPVALRRWRKQLFRSRTWHEIGELRRNLAGRQYDLIIDSQGLLKSALLCRLTHGVKWGFGPGTAREPLAARFYDRTVELPRGINAVERYRWLAAAALDYELEERVLPLSYGLEAPPLAADWLPANPYVVLCTATSKDSKLWAEERWLALGAWLNTQGYACVLPAGSAVEKDRAARLAAGMAYAVAAPTLNMASLAGLMTGSALVIGVDTGLTHLAVALHRRTLAIFCDSDPVATGVHGGERAINIGDRGAPPEVAEAVVALETLFRLPD